MDIRNTHIVQALALLLRILLVSNNHSTTVAVVHPGQYSNHPSPFYYSQSLSGYGNEKESHFNNPNAFGPSSEYSSETYQRQLLPPTSYGDSGGGGLDEGNNMQYSYDHQQRQNSFQPQSNYQDYLDGHFSPFRKEQDIALDSYGRQYATRQSTDAGEGAGSTTVSFGDIELEDSETAYHQPTDDVLYPPINQYSQYQHPVDYRTPNTTSLTYREMSHLNGNRATLRDNLAAANAGAQITRAVDGPPKLPRNRQIGNHHHHHHHQHHPRSYFDTETAQSQQQPTHHTEADFASNNNDKLLSHSGSSTYYVSDNDPTTSSTNYSPDAQLLTLPPNNLQHPPVSASQPLAFPTAGEPIPISKHVEITKHVSIPIYRQIHVPIRKPARIEIPRPMISTIPRPYAFQIPTITKTLAKPLVKEVKIPIEKVTPYPVEHRVPYIVEKRVPFQVEKQIPSPVFYPFPVKVPMIKTVIHKKRTHLPPAFSYHSKIHM